MTVSLYNTGVSGLLAAQQQLATTGHNIANVNTEGYVRQRAEQQTYDGLSSRGNYVGSGTYVSEISRIYDQFTYREQLINTSKFSNAAASNASLDQLNDVMSTSGQNVTDSLEQFYQAVNGLADNPSDISLRSITLSKANTLSDSFTSLNNNFDQLQKYTNGEIEQTINKINDISTELSNINEQILSNQGGDSIGQPNDLLDKRDQLLTSLAEYTNVTALESSDGVMTVMIGGGMTLVAGITPLALQVVAGNPDPLETKLQLVGKNGAVNIKANGLGGSLGAKFDFRDQHIKDAKNEIERLALVISETINDVQANGLDLTNGQGSNLFSDINSSALRQERVLMSSSNLGNLTAEITITDVSLLPATEFELTYNGTDYIMTDKKKNTSTNLGAPGSGTYSTPFGFEFTETSGAPSANDRFIIRPTKNAAARMDVVLSDPKGIATSSAVHVEASTNNTGAGSIDITQVYDPVNARLVNNMQVQVLKTAANAYSYVVVDNMGVASPAQAYNPPSQLIDLPPSPATALFQVEVKGFPAGTSPNDPEVFTIKDAFGLGNNTNVLGLALTQERSVLNGGQDTFSQSLAATVAKVGSSAKSAEFIADTAEALHTQAYNRNQSISGVSLDEEAANMLKFQQAYQAAAQIISTANTVFDTLLSVAR